MLQLIKTLFSRFRLNKQNPLFAIAFVLSIAATTGSLYLSLGMGLVPCKLCWYQRILMYPLVPLLGYSLVTEVDLHRLVLFFSGLGSLIAGYHSLLQLDITNQAVCTSLCTAILHRVGPFTVPNLALIAFLGITVSMFLYEFS